MATNEELLEQLNDMRTENEKLKKRVSATDRNVSAQVVENKRLQALADGKEPDTPEPPADDALDRRRDKLDRRERVLTLAVEKGIDPGQAFELLGLDADDGERLDRFIAHDEQIRTKAREDILGANGRTPVKNIFTAELTADDYDKMPNDMLQNIDSSVLSSALERAEPTEPMTLRQRLSSAFGGAK